MKILYKKEGASNIKVLVLFSLISVMLAALSVNIFAWPHGYREDGRPLYVNITNITDTAGNHLNKMNQSEYLANTSFTVTLYLNRSAQSAASIDVWYDVNIEPDGQGSGNNGDCSQDTTGSGLGPWEATIPAGGAANCLITDTSVVSIVVEVDSVVYYASWNGTGGPDNDTWNFTVDGLTPSSANIGLMENGSLNGTRNGTWQNSPVMRFNGSDSVATTLNYQIYVNGSVNTSGTNLSGTSTVTNDTLKSLTDGAYYEVLVELADNISNKLNSSPIVFFYDGTAPTQVNVTNINTSTKNFTNEVLITFKASDAAGQNLNYSLYINGSATPNASYSNGSNGGITYFTMNISQLVEGTNYNITIETIDNASHKRNSTPQVFWYDTTLPSELNIITPATENNWINSKLVQFNVTDATMEAAGYPLNYTIIINQTEAGAAVIHVNGTNLTSGWAVQNASLGANMTDGKYYNLTLRTKDYSGNANETMILVWYDGTAPTSINLTNLNTSSSSSGTNFTSTGLIQFKAADAGGHNLNYTVYLNKTENVSYSNGSNGGTTSFTLSSTELRDGTNWNITLEAKDNVSNAKNTTIEISFWYDATKPSELNIITPATENNWINSKLVQFNATDAGMEAANYPLNYTIIINQTEAGAAVIHVNGTNLTVNSSAGSVSTQNASLGANVTDGKYYNLTLRATDYAGNANETMILVWYDGTAPTSINLTNLNTSSSSTANNFTNAALIQFKAADAGGHNLNYTVYLNKTINVSHSNGSNGGTTTFALSSAELRDGTNWNITLEAKDNVSNAKNTTIEINFWYDATKPSELNIITPSEGSSVTNLLVQFNATDVGMEQANYPLNYTIIVNESGVPTIHVNGTNLTVNSSGNDTTTQNASLRALSEGYYNITLRVTDYAGNTNETSRLAFYDSTGPVITTNMSNQTSTSTREIQFYVQDGTQVNISSITVRSVNATEPPGSVSTVFNSSKNCQPLGNGSTGYNCTYIETGLEIGVNTINISAKDNASNKAVQFHIQVIPSATTKFNFSLYKDWNLISTPLILETNTISNLVANNSNITSIHHYSGTAWTTWFSTATDDLTTMTPLEGYWVYATANTSLRFFGNYTGSGPNAPSLSKDIVANRWYLIGHYSASGTDDVDTDDALRSLCGGQACSASSVDPSFDLVYSWTESTQTYVDIMGGDVDWTGDNLWDKGAAFWLHADAADTYTR